MDMHDFLSSHNLTTEPSFDSKLKTFLNFNQVLYNRNMHIMIYSTLFFFLVGSYLFYETTTFIFGSILLVLIFGSASVGSCMLIAYITEKYPISPKFKKQYIQHLKLYEQILDIVKTPTFQYNILIEVDNETNKLSQILKQNLHCSIEEKRYIQDIITEISDYRKKFKEIFIAEQYDENTINTINNWKKFLVLLEDKILFINKQYVFEEKYLQYQQNTLNLGKISTNNHCLVNYKL
jgi:hypothetical protein